MQTEIIAMEYMNNFIRFIDLKVLSKEIKIVIRNKGPKYKIYRP